MTTRPNKGCEEDKCNRNQITNGLSVAPDWWESWRQLSRLIKVRSGAELQQFRTIVNPQLKIAPATVLAA